MDNMEEMEDLIIDVHPLMREKYDIRLARLVCAILDSDYRKAARVLTLEPSILLAINSGENRRQYIWTLLSNSFKSKTMRLLDILFYYRLNHDWSDFNYYIGKCENLNVSRNSLHRLRSDYLLQIKVMDSFQSTDDRNVYLLRSPSSRTHEQQAIQRFVRELKALRKVIIHLPEPWSLYDLIYFKRNKAARLSKNSTLRDTFKSMIQDCSLEYQHYGHILNHRIKKGDKRATLMDNVRDELALLFGARLPEICAEKVLEYFNEVQLECMLKIIGRNARRN